MAYPIDLTIVLSGATRAQLANWRRRENPVLIPEVSSTPRVLYSFRDVVALRTIAKLRSELSLQKVRRAFDSLRSDLDLTDHPSEYKLIAFNDSVVLVKDGEATDLVKHPGQQFLVTMDDVFAEFENLKGQRVVNLLNPRDGIEVKPGRLSGWPTVRDTRVGYDTVAELVAGGVPPEEVPEYYPTVQAQYVSDAVDFADLVESA
ncbi:antitoxin [Gordonia phage Oregano]|uniref:MerR-like helix-turn-helix DNA binding protein n=1 Tax=Gordonia phage Howe TaxID=1777061 RepID=A0A0U4AZ77_9CAUD|nr:antitoxin [Gordonia phage Howe]AZF93229.1 antitoxin [Gordonia phage Adora]QDF16824.1 antitoxin [Gordonia phage Twinkle]QYC54443.1 MerR-like helix-turn-helix DNA binding domain protein [Gordonia phage Shlim410]UAJ16293.1 helix-turn-helix DNA binding domain protein [Gordonia phage Hortense]UTN93556.1 antitoxin [Gordonia phage Oregano]